MNQEEDISQIVTESVLNLEQQIINLEKELTNVLDELEEAKKTTLKKLDLEKLRRAKLKKLEPNLKGVERQLQNVLIDANGPEAENILSALETNLEPRIQALSNKISPYSLKNDCDDGDEDY